MLLIITILYRVVRIFFCLGFIEHAHLLDLKFKILKSQKNLPLTYRIPRVDS